MIESVALAVKHGITGFVLEWQKNPTLLFIIFCKKMIISLSIYVHLVIVFSTFFTLKSFVLSCVMEETVFHR